MLQVAGSIRRQGIQPAARDCSAHVVPGIEIEAEFRRVREAGCDHGQGFFFSVPVPPHVLTEMLATGQRWMPVDRTAPNDRGGRLRRRDTVQRPPWQSGLAERWGA